MDNFTIVHTVDRLADAMARAPGVVIGEADLLIQREAITMARDAKRRAPKALSILTNSIINQRVAPMFARVTARAGYAAAVEEGADPGGSPPLEAIRRWIEVAQITPRDEAMSERDLAFVIRRKIQRQGTPAQPFMRPAAETTADRLRLLLPQAAARGVRKALEA